MLSPEKRQELIRAFTAVGNPDAALVIVTRVLGRPLDLTLLDELRDEDADMIIDALRFPSETREEQIEGFVNRIDPRKQRRK